MTATAVHAPTMQRRWMVIAAVLVLISLPVILVVMEAVSFHVRNGSNGTMVSSGQTRDYLLYIPASYDRAKRTPLVISMHGAGLWGAAHRETSQWNVVAEREGFIVVYPSGAAGAGLRVWHVERGGGLVKDVTFISELIDTLEAKYNIDPARIYANGLSNGGGMSFALSCTLSDRIAAVGMVAAAQTLAWRWCKDNHPVPMIAFHGTADPVVPYNGGRLWISPRPFPSVPAWTVNWARRNRCGSTPTDSVVASDVTRREYTNCADNAAVVLYTIQGGGHTWPGGKPLPEWFVGSTSRSIDASSRMWAFFRAHPLLKTPEVDRPGYARQ